MRPTGYIYKCNDCGREYSTFGIMYLCPWCSPGNTRTSPPKGVLRILYDYPEIRKSITGFTDLKNNGFISLLPIDRIGSLPPLRVGNTPLYPVTELDGSRLPFSLRLKDDSQNPTWSFRTGPQHWYRRSQRRRSLELLLLPQPEMQAHHLPVSALPKDKKR
jgi:threonine synthase